jgi:serine/threonine protein phosphatase PrpC
MYSVGAGYSDVGRSRTHNEDSFYLADGRGLYIVADGMGGHASGEVASSMAINAASKWVGDHHPLLDRMREGVVDSQALRDVARQAVEAANQAVFAKANEHRKYQGMGCTFTLLLVVGAKAVMAHVGDTRLYLYRAGEVSQLTHDHTMANELALAGLIEKAEVPDHQYAHVLSRAVGTKAGVKIDTLVLDVLPADRFMLCSDGLSEYLEDEVAIARQLQGDDLEAIAQELVSYANTVGGSDNITAVVVEIRADEPEIEIVDEMSVDLSHKFFALESVFLFEHLSLALLTRVLDACRVDDYEPGDVVIEEDEPCERLMVAADGTFEVHRGGKKIGEMTQGEHAGVTTLLSPRRARATVTARTRGRMLTLGRDAFWKLVRLRPWLGVGLLERLGRQLSVDLDASIEKRGDGDPSTTKPEPHEQV